MPPGAAITPRAAGVDSRPGAAFDLVATGRAFLHQGGIAALSTLDPSGFPYGIITNVMPDSDGSPVFFAARIALHARNILADSRVSLAWAGFDQPDMLTKPRMTLVGHAQPVSGDQLERLRARYQRRFPKARLYLHLPDALIFRLAVSGVTIGGGPGRNAGATDFADLRHATEGAEALLAEEDALIDEANRDKPLLARLAAGARPARWQIVSIDPDGLDLAAGSRFLRHDFPARVTTAEAFRAALRQDGGAKGAARPGT